ncbi:YkoF family thiamine/hydroxymethylpyrimidine-binding protein [Aliiglaciecola sp. LCG003]|uniref:YkoF family thiamine/hydroxymethylpyrimidine-binding protein n=1 Tax=Aliiglaciecola sp. LCG003 TaxID=3053655 RepID=UPI00257345A5|nr:YkoF family thiamine/hydroxymethylpyrimidine-binding protein [Aliiglaciecola sp. LCG003]WJG08340.1 YkoF family thiamine/hydroxymethylpyrimidine-binding protein [Aliiglaciecola sp. LCG003]
MKLVVEISLYPLQNEYIPVIQGFIDRLNTYDQLSTQTSATSTIVMGENTELMNILNTEMQRTYEQVGQAIFVCKFLNGENMGSGR